MDRYIPTGNEMISLPSINEENASIESLTFLTMQYKGLIELSGTKEASLFVPFFIVNDSNESFCKITKAERINYWIPHFSGEFDGGTFEMTVLTPVKERGFAVKMTVHADKDITIKYGLKGNWSNARHCVNESKELTGKKSVFRSNWNNGPVFNFDTGLPLFAFAPMTDTACANSYGENGSSIWYRIEKEEELTAGSSSSLTVFWGFGFEEVASVTSAKEMLRRGFEYELDKTSSFLKKRIKVLQTPALTKLYNTNLFFCIFYSTGITLDTEELICATSRSTRYYVSAAYWDRDTLLWAFPAILDADTKLAGNILDYVFTRQRRNFGVHSRFIDGVMLEPGFELDELVAPVIALSSYVRVSKDTDILEESYIKAGIKQILASLSEVKAENTDLYSTFLQPTDDEIVYPYLTYDNMLVWKTFAELKYLDSFTGCRNSALYDEKCANIRDAIYNNCIYKNEDGKEFFAWSVDLKGHYDIYDEPPGSLQTLPYYGFCDKSDPIWLNTTELIRSPKYELSFAGNPIAEIGCRHAPYPWVLSLCNSLISGHEDTALKELEIIKMDNGIACESVDPVTGESTTGDAFATCAGFLCHSLLTACKNITTKGDN
jgi:hypothetical protein